MADLPVVLTSLEMTRGSVNAKAGIAKDGIVNTIFGNVIGSFGNVYPGTASVGLISWLY